ncbi:MAG: SIS domain-containing protein [Candidatus Gastranaerophilales bacterium]|nr:SIS domain-containing protein [Candidatus Gastranaerophilales bacterium]
MSLFDKHSKTAMEQEIYEQPEILAGILSQSGADGIEVPEKVNKIVLVASGSSYHCARFSADLLGQIAGIDARAIYSSEFLLKKIIPKDKNTLYIFITQSGETTDTVKALRRVNKGFEDSGGHYTLNTLSITNKPESTIWKETQYHIDCLAGEEQSIAATKSFTAQMLCVLLAALKIAKNRGGNIDEYIQSLEKLPDVLRETLTLRKKVHQLARLLSRQKVVVMLAEGISYAIAKEGALKIKETSYMNINAALIGEFMHGHLAVLNNKAAVIYLSVHGVSPNAANNLDKIKKEYNPSIFIIGKHNNKYISNFNINIDCENEILQMFSNTIICQLLALEIAENLHRNVDKPRGLKKVVLQ